MKQSSDLDVELDDGTGDAEYLERLDDGLDHAFAAARAGMAIFLAGADPYAGDRLGRLSLSRQGLAERDRLVFGRCARAGVPVAACMAGGYARDMDETVDIHLQTVRIAAGC